MGSEIGKLFGGGLTNAGVQTSGGPPQYFNTPGQAGIGLANAMKPYAQPTTTDTVGTLDNPVQQDSTPQMGALPKIFKPTFQQASTDRYGNVSQLNPAETKVGKLLHVLRAGAQGGLDAIAGGALDAQRGRSNFGAGVSGAMQMPMFRAQQQQAQQQAQTQQQLAQSQIGMLPFKMQQEQGALQEQNLRIKQLQGEDSDAVTFAPQTAPDGTLTYQGLNRKGQPVGPGLPNYASPTALKPHLQAKVGVGADGQQYSAVFDTIKGQYVNPDTQQVIPGFKPFEGTMVPKVKNTKSTTDLLGNTTTTSVTTPANGPAPIKQNGGVTVPKAVPGNSSKQQQTAAVISQPLSPDATQALAGVDPKAADSLKAMANYQVAPPSPRSKNYLQVMGILTKINPAYNAAQYPARASLQSDLATGKGQFSGLVPFNTAISHLDQLLQASEALKNGNIQVLNSLANKYKVATGQSAPVVFDSVKQAIVGELSKVYKGGNVTDQELSANGANLDSQMSPQQIEGAAGAGLHLMTSKIDTLKQFYMNGMGGQAPPQDFVYPASHSVLQKRGFEQQQQTQPLTRTFKGENYVQQSDGSWKKQGAQ